jgi:hypothetical protein
MFPSSFHVSLPSIDLKHNPIREDKKNKGGQKTIKLQQAVYQFADGEQ